jgi:predicted transcriptional regulator
MEIAWWSVAKEIKPVTDGFIEKLYKLYNGKIRFIMDSITQLGLHYRDNPHTLSKEEAEQTIVNIIKLKTSRLSQRDYECLQFLVNLEEDFTNDSIAKGMGMLPQNVSKFLKHLMQENLIYYSRRDGQRIYYRIVEQLKILVGEKQEEARIR